MFSHIMLGATDIEASKAFYDATLGAIGIGPGVLNPSPTGIKRYFYMTPTGIFAITQPLDGNAATGANGGTIGFTVADAAQGDAWHAAGVANGGTACEDAPGIREGSTGAMYLAYLRDPSGNKICALHRIPA
ncbi:MAG: VOC family protein [Gammaproteobacteria bacterium]|jgi:catechol 2,3-dioxygenase-like lactoylglutathione lyase family enzyme|nr:VOC family protein [Gammaproteobacteria bacterium]